MRAQSSLLGIAKWTALVLAALSTCLYSSGSLGIKVSAAALFAMTFCLWLPTIVDRLNDRHIPPSSPPKRPIRIARRLFLALVIFSVVLWLVSISFFVRVPYAHDRAIAIGGGSLSFQSGPAMESGGPMAWICRPSWGGFSLGESGECWAGWPSGQSSYVSRWPIGPPVVLLVALALGVFLDRPRQIPAGHCHNCGYNLTANQSGKCPECGTPRAEAPIAKRAAEQSTPAR